MPAKILDGKALAQRIKEQVKKEADELKAKGIQPGLAVVVAGDDSASRIYINTKRKACAETGIMFEEYALASNIEQKEISALIQKLNERNDIHGILVQQPLPGHINIHEINRLIDPKKDVDGFHPVNMGRLLEGDPGFIPCTPAGIMELIRESGVEISGMECVVIGRSNIVGKPAAILLMQANGTVTICHSKTRNIEEVCRRADILVVAAGKPGMVKGSMIKPGAVVIDVGINRREDRKIIGDVEFESAVPVAGAITPVPGGVGPMTIAMLMKNIIKAAKKEQI